LDFIAGGNYRLDFSCLCVIVYQRRNHHDYYRAHSNERLQLRYDCVFSEASDGHEAVGFIKSSPCDVIILDIRMPKKGGMDVIKEAKEVNPKVDILVVTGWISDDVSEEAIALGATDYIVKPLDLTVFNMKFAGILDKRGQKISKT